MQIIRSLFEGQRHVRCPTVPKLVRSTDKLLAKAHYRAHTLDRASQVDSAVAAAGNVSDWSPGNPSTVASRAPSTVIHHSNVFSSFPRYHSAGS